MIKALPIYVAALLFWAAPYLPANRVANNVPAGGASYFIEEYFEATGTPGSWSTSGAGTVDFDTDTTGLDLEGDECLSIDSSSTWATDPGSYSLGSEVWWHFRWRVPTASGNVAMFRFYDSGTNLLGELQYRSGGAVRVTSTGGTSDTSSALTSATTYDVWVQFLTGSGSDATTNVWCDPLGDKSGTPEVAISSTDGTTTADADYANIFGHSNTHHYDEYKVGDTDPGDNP